MRDPGIYTYYGHNVTNTDADIRLAEQSCSSTDIGVSSVEASTQTTSSKTYRTQDDNLLFAVASIVEHGETESSAML